MKDSYLHKRLRRIATRVRSPRWWYVLRGPTAPLSDVVGTDRGTPVDRFFIERFLESHADRVRGDVLDIKDRLYTTRYGGDRVTKSDILDINRENTEANIFGDIRDLAGIGDNSYDCFIITQVLQYVDDLHAAVRSAHRILKPGGSLLVTVPSLGKLDGHEDNVSGHFWRFTCDSARYLFQKHFAPQNLEINGWGNVLVATGMLQGWARQEIPRAKLEYYDPQFTCGVTICATK
jgi:SAM-dependent methyltransferase